MLPVFLIKEIHPIHPSTERSFFHLSPSNISYNLQQQLLQVTYHASSIEICTICSEKLPVEEQQQLLQPPPPPNDQQGSSCIGTILQLFLLATLPTRPIQPRRRRNHRIQTYPPTILRIYHYRKRRGIFVHSR